MNQKKNKAPPQKELLIQAYLELARTQEAQAKYKEAKVLLGEALRLSQLQDSNEDNNVSLDILAFLGVVESHLRNFSKAQSLLKHVLAIRERKLGLKHPDVANVLNSLGNAAFAQMDLVACHDYFQKALQIRREKLGEFHPEVAVLLNNFAILSEAQGNLEDAEHYYRQVIALYEHKRTIDQPEGANALYNLASFYFSEGKYPESEELFKRALDIRKTKFGLHHPHVASTMNNLAVVYQKLGPNRVKDAEGMLREALHLLETYSSDKCSIASTKNNLAVLYHGLEKYDTAEELMRESHEIYAEVLGSNHSRTKSIRRNLDSLQHLIAFPISREKLR